MGRLKILFLSHCTVTEIHEPSVLKFSLQGIIEIQEIICLDYNYIRIVNSRCHATFWQFVSGVSLVKVPENQLAILPIIKGENTRLAIKIPQHP